MKTSYKIKGMSCASCAHHIEKSVGKIPGVESCEVNFATETAKVVFDENKTGIDVMNAVTKPLGYELMENTKHDHMHHDMDHSEHLGLHESK